MYPLMSFAIAISLGYILASMKKIRNLPQIPYNEKKVCKYIILKMSTKVQETKQIS